MEIIPNPVACRPLPPPPLPPRTPCNSPTSPDHPVFSSPPVFPLHKSAPGNRLKRKRTRLYTPGYLEPIAEEVECVDDNDEPMPSTSATIPLDNGDTRLKV